MVPGDAARVLESEHEPPLLRQLPPPRLSRLVLPQSGLRPIYLPCGRRIVVVLLLLLFGPVGGGGAAPAVEQEMPATEGHLERGVVEVLVVALPRVGSRGGGGRWERRGYGGGSSCEDRRGL